MMSKSRWVGFWRVFKSAASGLVSVHVLCRRILLEIEASEENIVQLAFLFWSFSLGYWTFCPLLF